MLSKKTNEKVQIVACINELTSDIHRVSSASYTDLMSIQCKELASIYDPISKLFHVLSEWGSGTDQSTLNEFGLFDY